MIRMRVGYAGGDKDNPTYRSLGNHAETIEIEYDPQQITYEDLLEVFWRSHEPATRSYSRQYASIIFYHDEEQKRLAEETMAREAERRGRSLYTEIVPYERFWPAEEYHQKYYLHGVDELLAEYQAIYPDAADFVRSTAVARVNGYVGGHGDLAQLEAEIDDLGLSAAGQERLREIISR
ncbi:MAG: peptide-methionine (S)-S-oxide reductase [Anaerolineae bacterium]|nr:peptide-methionine (S)-S-oxide reductase [Anaerolineae bacterium]